MLDNDHAVARVAEVREGAEQAIVVTGVQADRGFIQHVQDALQPGAQLRGKPDALGLAAGEGVRAAVEGQIAEAHVHQEANAPLDLQQQIAGDAPLPLGHLGRAQALHELGHRPRGEVREAQATEADVTGEEVDP